jgi:Right handed beta helix region
LSKREGSIVCVVAVLALCLAPVRAHACNVTVPVGGSVEQAVNSAAPGTTVCLRGGFHTDVDRDFEISARGTGTIGAGDGQWVEVESFPSEVAVLYGQLVVRPEARRVRFRGLVLDGSGGPQLSGSTTRKTPPSPIVAGQSISFFGNEVTNRRTGICFHESPPAWGQASDLRIRFNRIHDCGLYPPENLNHGIYLQVPSSRAQITDNWIYDNADRCIQMYPDADGAYVARNVLDGCGEGILFGGSGENGSCAASDRNVVEQNVISNARARWLVEAFWGCWAVGAGNLVRANCLWPSNPIAKFNWNGGLDGTAGYSTQANLVADPQFVSRAAKDFRLRAGSPCAGKGPSSIPGP